MLWAVHALFMREIVALLLRVSRHASRSQWGVSPELLSPAELRSVHQWEVDDGRLEPLSPTGSLLRLIDLRDYRVTMVNK